jgi:hypothetical protein
MSGPACMYAQVQGDGAYKLLHLWRAQPAAGAAG